jgi:hypothetical protein
MTHHSNKTSNSSSSKTDQRVVEELADLLVSPLPVLKFVQRAGFALVGKIDDFLERKAIQSLVRGVDQKDDRAIAAYQDSRSLFKCDLPKFVRELIVSLMDDAFRSEIAKEGQKAVRKKRSSEFEMPKHIYPGKTISVQTVGVDHKSMPHLSSKNLLAVIPPNYESLAKALEALAAPAHRTHTEECEFVYDGPPQMRFDFKVELSGHDFNQAFKKTIEVMIKARFLEDYLAQKKCSVSAATFNSLLNEFNDPVKLVSSAKVQGVVALNNHLCEKYPALTELERAAVLTSYGLKNKPVVYFEKAQSALAAKLLRKKERYERSDEQLPNSTLRSEEPAQARKLSQSELTKVVLSQLSPRARAMQLKSEPELAIAASRIAKCARKTTITVVGLQQLIKEADDPVQTIVMMVRRPETDDAVVEDKKAQKPADKPSAPAVEVSSETTYISQGQRKELRGIFERGELTFAEFRTILKKNFNTSFDPRTGPGSHSDLIRHRSDGKPVVAQVSPDVRNGREACHLGIIEATLKDLHIKPEEFLTALKKHRNVT